MTPEQLQAWMLKTGTSKAEIFRRTGVARTTIDRYLAGTYPIPKVFVLALMAIECGIVVED